MSLGKVFKKVGAGLLVTLIESGNGKFSIEYNIVPQFFSQKKIFFFKNLPFGVGAGI